VVVLDKGEGSADRRLEPGLVETFKEKPPVVSEDLGFKQDDVGDGKRRGPHQNTFSLMIRMSIVTLSYGFVSKSFSTCP
jgi:hypothetical protein